MKSDCQIRLEVEIGRCQKNALTQHTADKNNDCDCKCNGNHKFRNKFILVMVINCTQKCDAIKIAINFCHNHMYNCDEFQLQ